MWVCFKIVSGNLWVSASLHFKLVFVSVWLTDHLSQVGGQPGHAKWIIEFKNKHIGGVYINFTTIKLYKKFCFTKIA